MTLQTFLRRLIWVCMAPLLLLALVALVVNLWQSRKTRDTDLEQDARLARQYIDLKIGSHARGLNMLATSPHLAEAELGEDFYREAQAFHTHFGDHIVLAHQGRMLMNTRVPLGAPLPLMPQVRGRSAVQEALETGQLAVGDVFEGPLSKSLLLAMAVPISDPARTGQILLATIEASRFEQRLQEIPLPAGVSALLLDSTGRQIAARGRVDLLESGPPPFGKRLVLPLELVRWTLVFETDGIPEQTALLTDATLWLTALALAAGAAYFAARSAGKSLENGLQSLATPSTGAPARRDIAEVGQVRDRLLQLNLQRDQQQAELRQLLTQIGHTQELERKRIALDIHDDLQQTLASLKLSATSLYKADADDQQALRRQLAQALVEQASQAVQSTRRIIDDLRPQMLDDLGLEAALESLVARFGRETGVEATFQAVSASGDELAVEPGLAIALYRVAQEALNNVRKHARAQTVALQLSQPRDVQLELRVTDDGQGLPPRQTTGSPGAVLGGVDAARAGLARSTETGSGLGLAGMRERMRAVGGSLELRSALGGGTEVVALAPIGSGPAV